MPAVKLKRWTLMARCATYTAWEVVQCAPEPISTATNFWTAGQCLRGKKLKGTVPIWNVLLTELERRVIGERALDNLGVGRFDVEVSWTEQI